MKKLIIALLFLSSFLSGYSQVVSGYKYAVSKKVFDDIVNAYGESMKAPAFVIRPKKAPDAQILNYYPGEQPKIIMDEEIYDLCTGMGKDSLNALAALLGHELAHHFEKHDWCISFSYLLSDNQDLKKKLGSMSTIEKTRLETRADVAGGLYGYISGYGTFDITAKLLDKIYTHYKLPDNLPGYPSKKDRKLAAKTALKELEKYQVVFDAGLIMLCLKEYESAAECFEYLTDKFPSREMFGNAGLAKVLEAMDMFDSKNMPFILPLEIDASSRLNAGAHRSLNLSADEKLLQKEKLLREAIKYFDKAINLEPNYATAHINKGCAYALLDSNFAMSIGIANDIINTKSFKYTPQELSKAYSLRGIARYYKKENAEDDFEQAKKLNDISRNAFNLSTIKELKKGTPIELLLSKIEEKKANSSRNEKPFNPSIEKIGGSSANEPINPKDLEVKVLSLNTMKISFVLKDTYKDLRISKEKDYRILMTEQNYSDTTSQGIKRLDKMETIKLKYGEPTYTVDETNGVYLVYRKTRIVFLLDQNMLLRKWFTYY